MMVSEDALAVRRLKAAPVVQNSRADHWGDIKCSFEQALIQLTITFSNDTFLKQACHELHPLCSHCSLPKPGTVN